MRRRSVEAFGLSFLDCICCGFGAVILFYVLMSAQGSAAATRPDPLRAEVDRVEAQVRDGRLSLTELHNQIEQTKSATASAQVRYAHLLDDMQRHALDASRFDATSLAKREHINQLKADIQALEAQARRLEGGSLDGAPPGQEVRAFRGTGDRRYVTGLRMRGERILILMDTSASMLHEDLVNVILLRNSGDDKRRAAAKWRRAVDSVNWLLTQFPPGAKFQIYGFNVRAQALIAGTTGQWLDAGDARLLAQSIAALQSVVPANGTSLINALNSVRTLDPMPDQIILITDGLPTQGATPPALSKYADVNERARLFDAATKARPQGVPIDVVLLPMKGDNPAPHRFWNLTRESGGTLIMPSKDWP